MTSWDGQRAKGERLTLSYTCPDSLTYFRTQQEQSADATVLPSRSLALNDVVRFSATAAGCLTCATVNAICYLINRTAAFNAACGVHDGR